MRRMKFREIRAADAKQDRENNSTGVSLARRCLITAMSHKLVKFHKDHPDNKLVPFTDKYFQCAHNSNPKAKPAGFQHTKGCWICQIVEDVIDPEAEAAKLDNEYAAHYCLFGELIRDVREYHDLYPYDTSIKAIAEMLVNRLNYTKQGERDDLRVAGHSPQSCFLCNNHNELPPVAAPTITATTTTTFTVGGSNNNNNAATTTTTTSSSGDVVGLDVSPPIVIKEERERKRKRDEFDSDVEEGELVNEEEQEY